MLRWAFRIAAVVLLLLVLVVAFIFRGSLHKRFVQFPREARAWEELRANRTVLQRKDQWREYRGVCHSHSELSHDCMVPFEEILGVLKDTETDFICMSDHCDEGKADFSKQWRGLKEGKLFVPGYEMGYGFMPFGVPDDIVLDKGEDEAVLAQQIEDSGGLLFFAHTEQDRSWDLPQLVGMEIYNIHTDFSDESFSGLMPDLLLNLRAYPDQSFRLLFDRQTAILENWDRLNADRDITGIAANDCHQNNGVIGTYTEAGTLLVRDTSPDTKGEYGLNPITRLLLRIFCGPLEPGRVLFHFQLDPYERMVRYVRTHVLAQSLSERDVLDALKDGRAFIGFDMIVDSTGFNWEAEAGGRTAVMGQSLPFSAGTQLRAASPCPCRFTVIRNGEQVHQETGSELTWPAPEAGKYRVEAELRILDEWVPWVYTNPISLT